MPVSEGEWIVAVNDAGEHELVQAKSGGFLVLHANPCETAALVGAEYGTCFDLRRVRDRSVEDLSFISRYGDKWETKRFVKNNKRRNKGKAKKAKSKKAKTTSASQECEGSEREEDEDEESIQDEESEDGIPLFEPVPVESVVGVYKSSTDELEQERQQLLERLLEVEGQLGVEPSVANVETVAIKSNKNIIGHIDNQKLKAEEIAEMVQSGVDVTELVEKLAANNKSFNEMTEYTKEKYREKKTKKFSRRFRILPATAQTLASTMWDWDTCTSFKLGSFRPVDVLPQMLGLANIQAGSRVLVVESLWGLLAGSILERLGGMGKLFVGYANQDDPMRMIDFFNFSEAQQQPLERIDLVSLTRGDRGDENEMILQGKLTCTAAQQEANAALLQEMNEGSAKESLEQEQKVLAKVSASIRKRLSHKTQDFQKQREIFESIRDGGVESLVIASKFEPRCALLALLPFLSPGSPFVVYSENLGSLMQARVDLVEDAANMRLSETFFRIHQVLPGRTHPEMNMSGRGGYLLSGYRITPGEKESNIVKSNKFFRAKKEKDC